MKCPNCGAAKLVHDTRDMPYTYKGEETTIAAVTGDYCPACGEAVLDMGESVRTSTLMLEFNKQVNAAIVDPSFIVGVRKKLHLDQREELFSLNATLQILDLSNRSRYKRLSTPPWIYGHNENQIANIENIINHVDRCAWIKSHTILHSHCANLGERAM